MHVETRLWDCGLLLVFLDTMFEIAKNKFSVLLFLFSHLENRVLLGYAQAHGARFFLSAGQGIKIDEAVTPKRF